MSSPASLTPRILVYILRRDLRLADNPIFHQISRPSKFSESGDSSGVASSLGFTHVLPVYVFAANQVEVSGFLTSVTEDGAPPCPYPEARSRVAGFWRCGKHRATFLAQSVWDLKCSLEHAGSGLEIRVGLMADVVKSILEWYTDRRPSPSGRKDSLHEDRGQLVGIWMSDEEGVEEIEQEKDVKRLAEGYGVEFRNVSDEKYFIDDCDLPFDDIFELPDVYTSFRKVVEPLRSQPRPVLPAPQELPPLPPSIPPQQLPFCIPSKYPDLVDSLLKPLDANPDLEYSPTWPEGTENPHPFTGGEKTAHTRLLHLLISGAITSYKDTRNGLLGQDYSTKLSGWLALGCLTARQVHAAMVDFEEGRIPFDDTTAVDEWESAPGFGEGESKGTSAVRFELLWRDYMRLCARKFGAKLFNVDGFRGRVAASEDGGEEKAKPAKKWKYISHATPSLGDDPAVTRNFLDRFCSGQTGVGLIDASQRELFLTGYTSNRARQNVASFLASHLGIDWRLGAEWYESMLIDYDVSSNWGNWQYVAGVGNDPRQGRVFNPIKQALDYDGQGQFVKAWVQEVRDVDIQKTGEEDTVDREKLMGLFQAWRLPEWEKDKLGLRDVQWVRDPLLKIPFSVSGKRPDKIHGERRRSRGQGGWWRGRGRGRPKGEKAE